MKNTEKVLEALISDGLLSHAAIRVGKNYQILGEVYSEGVTEKTLFDMASVTKIMATTTISLIAIHERKLNLSDRVSQYYDVPEWYENLTIFHLLTHTMGIGHKDLTDEKNTYDNIGEYILSLKGNPIGIDFAYSCPAFILLGKILEKIYGKRLDVLFDEKVAMPLGLRGSCFLPDINQYTLVNSNLEEEKIGVVNDYNCQYLGGVAGNAGLFSNIDDITVYVNLLLEDGRDLFPKSLLDMASENQTAGMSESWGLGFLYVDDRYKQTGDLFPIGSIGHCGHTGQSVFLNRESGLYAVILTDASISTVKKYGRERYGEVTKMRETLHNAIKKDLEV